MSRRTVRRAMLILGSALGVLAMYSSAAFAAGAPIVTAGTPELRNLTTAKLEGTINPNGASTTYKVEYGKTKLYGQTTQSFTIESGSVAVPFYIELPGVEQMSTYHFRVSATNSSGTTNTSDALFESLHSWTVEGKRVTELATPAYFEDSYKSGVSEGHAEFRGFLGGKTVRVYCKQSASIHGALGLDITGLVFKNGCFFQELGGINKKIEACKPLNGITLTLNGALGQTAPVVVELGEECAFGEKLTIANGGFYVPLPNPDQESIAEFNGYGYATNYFTGAPIMFEAVFSAYTGATPGSLKLTGVNAGKKFGTS